MSDGGVTSPESRDYVRVGLVVCCLLATVLVAILVPSLTGGGIAESPAESALPGNALSSDASADGGPGAGTGDSLGALNPGDSTDIGGAIDTGNSFRSQDTRTHMTVRSPRRAYWRTGSYDDYTGSGWAQTGESRTYTGRIRGAETGGQRVEYRMTLNRSARAVPTVWRPTTVDGLDGLEVTAGESLRVDRPLEPGTTYTGVSRRPPRDPSVLRSTGTDYPERIETRYARLDPSVSRRVVDRTDEITAGADSPYEEARAIEQWLEENKGYSLNVSRTSPNMAETFIFEMERGYCEYFATSMVVMLRSQDVPARYVVGYSTGQRVGENTYRVREMNAHAWVEVYFEDVGWVKFDPTPGGARLQEEQESIQRADPGAEYSPAERGSPGEELTPTGEGAADAVDESIPTDSADVADEDVPVGQTDAGYDISLNRTAVPGVTVTVTVRRDGDPLAGRTVLFDGQPVGTTGADGTVTAEVPYVDELRVGVEEGTPSLSPPGSVPRGQFYSVERLAGVPAAVTVPVRTNATVTVSGERMPGSTVTVTATVADVPVRDAAVHVDGRRVGTTDADGRATVELPASPGNVTVAVEREPIRGETVLVLPDLAVSVRPKTPLALPLAGATVEVRAGDRPVSDVAVRIDGRRVGTTDFNGTTAVSLPLAPRVTVSATTGGLTAETTVSGLFLNLAFVVAGLGVPLGGVVVFARRRGYTLRALAGLCRRVPGLLVQRMTWLLVALVRHGDSLAIRAVRRLRETVLSIRAALAGVSVRRSWLRLRAWLGSRRDGPAEGTTEDGEPGGSARADGRHTVREAWRRFLAHVSVSHPRTKTPGEIARHAVRRDELPAEPVGVLRDTFREVEYGSRPAEDRLPEVKAALSAVERAVETDETRADGGAETERRGEQ